MELASPEQALRAPDLPTVTAKRTAKTGTEGSAARWSGTIRSSRRGGAAAGVSATG